MPMTAGPPPASTSSCAPTCNPAAAPPSTPPPATSIWRSPTATTASGRAWPRSKTSPSPCGAAATAWSRSHSHDTWETCSRRPATWRATAGTCARWSARRRRTARCARSWARAARPRPPGRPEPLLLDGLSDGVLELVRAERAPEARGDLAAPVEHEHPRLCLQMECRELRPIALVRVVVVVDLHVDEGHALRLGHRVLDLLGDVRDGPAHPALAQQRRGEQQDDRLLADHVAEVHVVHVVVRRARVDRGDVAVHRLHRGSRDQRGLLPRGGNRIMRRDLQPDARRLELAIDVDGPQDVVLAG